MVAAPQFLAHGQHVMPVQVNGGNNQFVNVVFTPSQHAGLPQIRGQFQCNLDRFQGQSAGQNNNHFLGFLDSFHGWSASEKFSIKMAYDFFRPRGTKKIQAADVWRPCITPKHSFFLWLGVQSKLLTKDKLQFLDIDRNCVFCGHMAETGCQLFFECSFTSSIQGNIRQ